MNDEIITALSQKTAYDHAVSDPIEIKNTHISTVFLTGKYAYKIKKPISFDFLDFTSLEKRHHFCLQELNLNRKFSPEIYLDVVPIVRNSQGNIIIGNNDKSGVIIEWAVKMLEFNQEDLLLNLSKKQKVNARITCMLAKCIADFHENSESISTSSEFGSFDSVRNVVQENFAETESGIGHCFAREDFLAIKTYQEVYLEKHKELFLSRKKNGKIRSCHGDLHLGNICFFNEKVMLFDCIEFSEDFRNIDVLYDIAFTIMDYQFRGMDELANLLLNQYLEWTADYEDISILSFYCSIRAYIRAKVLYLSIDPERPNEQKDKRGQMNDYIALAKKYSHTQTGALIVICGISGTGKTTLARELAKKIGAIHLRSDVIRKHLGQIGIMTKGDASLYSDEMNKKTYEKLEELAFKLYPSTNVIVDAKYDLKQLRAPFLSKKEAGAPIVFVHCVSPTDELKNRLEKRKGDISDADASLLEKQQQKWQEFSTKEACHVVVIDTRQNLQTQVQTCINIIE